MHIKKLGAAVAISIWMFFCGSSIAFSEIHNNEIILKIDEYSISVNNKSYNMEDRTIIYNKIGFIPLRSFGEILGGSVKWYKKNSKVMIRIDNNIIYYWVGKNYALLNGEYYNLESKAIYSNDKVYVPIKSFGEMINYTMKLGKNDKEIVLSKKNEEKLLYYEIAPGDTLWDISIKFDISINNIKLSNGLKNDMIYVGQILKISNMTELEKNEGKIDIESSEKINVDKLLDEAIKNVDGNQDVLNAQGYLSLMKFPIGDYGINENGVDGKYGKLSKFWIMEFKYKKGLEVNELLTKEVFEEMKKSVVNNENMNSLGIKQYVNPAKDEVIKYIVDKSKELGIPENIGLSTAWMESKMKHFNSNGVSGPSNTNDWGIMQINKNSHKLMFKGSYDNDDKTPDLVHNWKDSVDYGLELLKSAFQTAIKNDEGNKGLFEKDINLACSAYSTYNSGKYYFRYRLTKDEAEKLNLGISGYGKTINGYDKRDIDFREIYINESYR